MWFNTILVTIRLLHQFCRLQVEDVQCFPLEESPGEAELVWACDDGVANQTLLYGKSSPKNLDKILDMVKHVNSLLDLCALFFGWIG